MPVHLTPDARRNYTAIPHNMQHAPGAVFTSKGIPTPSYMRQLYSGHSRKHRLQCRERGFLAGSALAVCVHTGSAASQGRGALVCRLPMMLQCGGIVRAMAQAWQ